MRYFLAALGLVLAAAAGPVLAQNVTAAGPTVAAVANGFTVTYGSNGTALASSTRTAVAGATSGEALIRDMFSVTTKGGQAAVTASRAVTASEVAAGLARGLANPAIAAAIIAAPLLADWYTRSRVRPAAGGGLEIDEGRPGDTQQVVCYSTNVTGGCVADWESAVLGWAATAYPGASGKAIANRRTCNPNDSSCILFEITYQQNPTTRASLGTFVASAAGVTSSQLCIDPQSGETSALSPLGDCPMGRYTTASQAQAAAMLERGRAVPGAAPLPELAKATVNAGAEVKPKDPVPQLSGPASVTGQSKTSTTTNPDGSKTTATTTPTTTLTYAPGSVTTSDKVSTVTAQTPAGSTAPTSTTTTETDTPAETPGQLCDYFPDIVACAKVGQAPDDSIPKADRTVSMTPETVALPSGCPADVALPGGRTLSYATACESAEQMRPFILAAAAVTALLIAVAAIRGAS